MARSSRRRLGVSSAEVFGSAEAPARSKARAKAEPKAAKPKAPAKPRSARPKPAEAAPILVLEPVPTRPPLSRPAFVSRGYRLGWALGRMLGRLFRRQRKTA